MLLTTTSKTYDLIIPGGGPTGLLAGLLACRSGLDVLILEKTCEPELHSRSIGIHPPSLRLLSEAGVLDDFLGKGLAIRRGHALVRHRLPLGTLDFGELAPPFNHILAIPQWITEMIITQKLADIQPGILQRGIAVTGLRQTEDRCEVQVADGRSGETGTLNARMVLGCDGKKSTVRQLAGIPFIGDSYQHRYVMGDFTDHTGYGSDAVIFLSRGGLVECFPMPGGTRRWVMQLDSATPADDTTEFVRQVQERCGIAPDPDTCSMFSVFGVERYLAERFWQGRVVLAGDAAHVTSPIGGQGMNLGWINAAEAVQGIAAVLRVGSTLERISRSYNRSALKRARKVIRRAEFNMLLGNRSRIPGLRNRLVRMLLGTPLRKNLIHRFTMQGL
jgi:2-polyprenyl-6-methoxyphenol hydroxylase-like FAD-dependent oxidoreductase